MSWNEITLPWPDRALSPNARGHWSKRHKAAKKAREWARWKVLAAAPWSIPADGRLHLWICFFPPDRRRRDDDNLIAMVKPYRDGLADALGIDDSRFICHPWVGAPTEGGGVRFRITAGPS